MLDRPAWADQIIADLARWEDWSVMERLVQMFKDAESKDEISRLSIRVAVAHYLAACPLPEAEQHLAELRRLDGAAIEHAERSLILPGGGSPRRDDGEETAAESDPIHDFDDGEGESPPPEAGSAPTGDVQTQSTSSTPVPNGNAAASSRATKTGLPGPDPIWPAALLLVGVSLLFAANVAIFLGFRAQR
jgi:hypothetical protein